MQLQHSSVGSTNQTTCSSDSLLACAVSHWYEVRGWMGSLLQLPSPYPLTTLLRFIGVIERVNTQQLVYLGITITEVKPVCRFILDELEHGFITKSTWSLSKYDFSCCPNIVFLCYLRPICLYLKCVPLVRNLAQKWLLCNVASF